MHRWVRFVVAAVLFASCGSEGVPRSAPGGSSPVPTPGDPGPAASVAKADDPVVRAAGGTGTFPPLTLVASDGQVLLYDDAGHLVESSGIVTADGDAVVGSRPSTTGDTTSTVVEWRRIPTGALLSRQTVEGELTVSAVSSSGMLAALTDAEPGGTKATTRVAVVDRVDGVLGRWDLEGNLVPEAFANASVPEGKGMPIGVFVIEYLAPDTYRVRVIDTATGELGLPLNLRDKSQTVDEAMKAVSRTAIFDPVDQLLFTLYQGTTDDMAGRYAFIHTLGLINGVWCLEVPEQLDLADHTGALAVGGRGRLFVASPNGGVAGYAVADIVDVDAEPVADAVAQLGADGSRVALAVGPDEVVVAVDGTVMRLDPATLAVRDSFTWDMDIEALAVVDDHGAGRGDLVIVGTRRITVVSPDHQLVAERGLPPGVAEISRIEVGTPHS